MIGLLPWEKILPPYVLGPVICLLSMIPLFSEEKMPWYLVALMPFSFLFGAWATYVWFKRRENVFDMSPKKAGEEGKAEK